MNFFNSKVAGIVNVYNNVFKKTRKSKEKSSRTSISKENIPFQNKPTVVVKNDNSLTVSSKSNKINPYIIVTKTVVRTEGTFNIPVIEVSHVDDQEKETVISKKTVNVMNLLSDEIKEPVSVDASQPVLLRHQYSTESNYMADSGLSLDDIDAITEKFKQCSTENGKLNKDEFILLYNQVRFEDPERLKKISEIVYKAFDMDDVNI